MFQDLAKAGLDWTGVDLFFVDERIVPPEDDRSNFRMTKENLLDALNLPAEQIHRIRGEDKPEEAAREYLRDLRGYFALRGNEVPVFDIVQLGMGGDGHTASLFPGGPFTHDRTGVAAHVYVEKLDMWRVTLLPEAILAARHKLFLISGADKAAALQAVLQGPLQPDVYPSQIVARDGENVEWFVDEAAAGAYR